MPDWLRSLVELLPLKYLYAVPIQVLQGRTQLEFIDGILIAGTLVAGWLGLRWMWQAARRQYAAVGG